MRCSGPSISYDVKPLTSIPDALSDCCSLRVTFTIIFITVSLRLDKPQLECCHSMKYNCCIECWKSTLELSVNIT